MKENTATKKTSWPNWKAWLSTPGNVSSCDAVFAAAQKDVEKARRAHFAQIALRHGRRSA